MGAEFDEGAEDTFEARREAYLELEEGPEVSPELNEG